MVIDIQLQFSTETVPRRLSKTISVVDYSQVNTDLLNVDWGSELSCNDVNNLWQIFLGKLREILCKNTRHKTIHENPRKPWISNDLLHMVRLKQKLWLRFKKSGRDAEFLAHRQFSNRLSRLLKQARSDFESRIASSPDKRLFFKTVRRRLQSKVTAPLLQRSPGVFCTSKDEVANEFARCFYETFVDEPDGVTPQLSGDCSEDSLSSVAFSAEVVGRLLSELDVKAPGPDRLDSLVLKRCCYSLALPLSIIMQRSFQQHSLPRDWLLGIVTPIFKKGNKLLPCNYRPITLTSLVCKIAEKIVHSEILQFSIDKNILPIEQHGFIPGRSVVTNLLSSVNDWTTSVDRGLPVDVVYLDFSRAFDRVPRRRLLTKLNHYGIRGDLLLWIEAYLTDRKFQVRVDDTLSEQFTVSSGVPQGSTLGPLLFLLYTADLPKIIKSKCSFFADDLKLYGNPLDPECVIQEDLVAIKKWCDDWLLPLNVEKCSILHIGKNNPRYQYIANGSLIKPVNSQLDLGVVVSEDLCWSRHIQHIASKANRMSYLISKAFPSCSLENLGLFYKVYIRPILEYAGPVWHPTLQRDVELLERVQRRSTRLTLGPHRPSYEERKRVCGLSDFMDRKRRGDLIVTYRALHGFFGADMSYLYELNLNSLRGHSYKLKKEKFSSVMRQHFLSNRVFDSWNGLPDGVVGATSVNQFKNRYDDFDRSTVLNR